ncbi:GMP synthase [glutamine-hydrolyzing] [Spirochaetota bacterium]|nr:GMP synthase [glutamine-hydrolyzing] [Spirochaetota bacterium]
MKRRSDKKSSVIIIDFGSQYTRLIARRVRGLGYYSRVVPATARYEEVMSADVGALIFSGGPESVTDARAPKLDETLLTAGVPILGICYGMCLLVRHYGGVIASQRRGEYGPAMIDVLPGGRKVGRRGVGGGAGSSFYRDVPNRHCVWMSHGDSIVEVPNHFTVTALSRSKAGELIASFEDRKLRLYGVQYHPEVVHTVYGEKLLKNFLQRVACLRRMWSVPSYLKVIEKTLRREVGPKRSIVVAVSGGVDSTVMAVLLARLFKRRLKLVLVDNGLLREDEVREISDFYENHLQLPLRVIDAKSEFLTALAGVRDPERKRHIIGRMFVKVFFANVKPIEMLAQGTLYPDVIESIATVGPSHKIKTHHNRVPEILALMKRGQIVEPFKDLFKDEVRELGLALKIPSALLNRHPFPGPGLAVRIVGTVTKRRLDILRKADAILQSQLKKAKLIEKTWQIFAVLLPVRSVGVAGDRRYYGATIVIRAVSSLDGMTADFFLPSKSFLTRLSARITGEVEGITRVVLDISSKPPATIEWE